MILKTFYDMPMHDFLMEVKSIALDLMVLSFSIAIVFGSLAMVVRLVEYVRAKT